MSRSAAALAPALILGLLTATVAQAAPARAVPPRPAARTDTAKLAACERVWAAQKVHVGAHKAFVAACVAKG
jgi:hypothetical protein